MLRSQGELRQDRSEDPTWKRVKEIFWSAVDLNPDERAAVLALKCVGDVELQQKVEQLLFHNDIAGGPLDRSPVHQGQIENSPEDGGFSPGDLICARFVIRRFIGKGGMGEVFEAEDSVLGEHIAIKTIRHEIANQLGLVERLRKEVQLSRQVSHVNVCRVFELWEHQDSRGWRTSFLTMELLRGETLAQVIEERGPFTPKDALPIIRQIAQGLNEVHRAGIVHRDLKPSNLYLVTQSDGAVRVLVTDFGLARAVDPTEYSRTQSGAVFGTPAYMAPEQFETGEATFASDIYSFGVTIFEMLTGRKHPLTITSLLARKAGQNWCSALEKCWNPKPEERPQTPLAVVALLERPNRYRRLRGWLKPVGALAALILLIAVSGYELMRDPPETRYRLTNVTSNDGLSWEPSFSADGRTLAYSSDITQRGDFDIWVRRLDTAGPPVRVTDSPANDAAPSLSPDGQSVVYTSDRPLQHIYLRNIAGGPERLLSAFGDEPLFSPDGKRIVFWTGQDGQFSATRGRIFVTDIANGSTRQVARDFLDARHPVWIPGGKDILFEGCGPGCANAATQRDWWTIDLDGQHASPTGALQTVLKQGLSLFFSAPCVRSGSIFFAARTTNDTNIWRISQRAPLLPAQWRAFPIMSSTEEAVTPSVSSDGAVAFAGLNAKVNLWIASLDGRANLKRLGSNVEINSAPSISHEGNRILYFRRLGNERRMIVRELSGNEILNVAIPADTRGLIAGGGDSILYTKPRGELRDLYLSRAPGWKEELVKRDSGELLDVNREVTSALVATRQGILHLNMRSRDATVILPNSELTFDDASLSPNGQWISYVAHKNSQQSTIFVAPFLGRLIDFRQGRSISDQGAWNDKPRWTKDGDSVVYISDRDGFRCLWRQELDRDHHARGVLRSVAHFHQSRLSPINLSRLAFNLSVCRDWVLFNLADQRANIWIARPEL